VNQYRKETFMKVIKDRYWLVILVAIFLFSFILDIYLLTRYSLSYGIDGAFYDIQVRNILNYGFPASNDPPLAYYLLTPFVVVTGSSFLGIKLGMAFLGSLMAFPAYLLTQCYINKKGVGSKIPALLAAFLITVNINYFAMVGNFMQNLVGVVFLTFFMYFLVKWLENISNWKKYGVLAALFLGLNLLTHIYTGALAVILFISLILFNILFKIFKTHKTPKLDLKVMGIMSLMIMVCFMVLFVTYPVMFSKYTTVASFFNITSTSNSATGAGIMGSSINGSVFFSLPYLLGIAAAIIILYRGFKENITDMGKMKRNTLLAWMYLTLGVVLGVLSMMSTEYQSRFILMAFLPIALIIPLGLKFFENLAILKYPDKKKYTTLLVTSIAVVFAFSSFFVASESFESMSPTITLDEYNELLAIKENQSQNNSNTVIVAQDFQIKYWVEYVLGGNVSESSNIQQLQEEYNNSTIYVVTTGNGTTSGMQPNDNNAVFKQDNDNSGLPQNNSSTLQQNNNQPDNLNNPGSNSKDVSYSGSFLLPYGPPILPNSIDEIPFFDSESQSSQNKGPSQNPMDNGNQSSVNGLNGPPSNSTDPSNFTPPSNFSPPSTSSGSIDGGNFDGRSLKGRQLTLSGTIIYSGKYFTLTRIN